MATMTATPVSGTPTTVDRRTARTTGALYLALALTGMVGFLVVRPVLFDADPATTLANLQEHGTLARFGIAAEMAIVVTQALAALWFFRLFRAVDDVAAGAIALFGAVNAVAVMISAACLATALDAAQGRAGADAGTPQLLYALSENLWGVGNVFFGLWLVPMGWCVLRSATMPHALGWILVVGGAGYVLSAFVTYLLPGAGAVASVLVVPATIGELWMVGYLLSVAGRARS